MDESTVATTCVETPLIERAEIHGTYSDVERKERMRTTSTRTGTDVVEGEEGKGRRASWGNEVVEDEELARMAADAGRRRSSSESKVGGDE